MGWRRTTSVTALLLGISWLAGCGGRPGASNRDAAATRATESVVDEPAELPPEGGEFDTQ